MKFLLDTHTLLWAISEPEKLSTRVRTILEEPSNQLQVSSVSLFEVATKVRIGKLRCPLILLEHWSSVFTRLGASPLALEVKDALRAGRWEVEHRDPFDRLLAAQAFENQLCLLSLDKAFEQFEGLEVLW